MRIKAEALETLKFVLKSYHNNKISDLSRDTNIDKSYISGVLSGKRGVGTTFILKMNKYCDRKKIKRIVFF